MSAKIDTTRNLLKVAAFCMSFRIPRHKSTRQLAKKIRQETTKVNAKKPFGSVGAKQAFRVPVRQGRQLKRHQLGLAGR
ncbi:MAG: hypothetical protein HZA02_07070 [Nitrospinae bacterium]|nr:hypothetical protein [Nitrospinota bacterium]